MSHKTVYYLHIPKTGGTTLRNILHRQYKESSVYTIDYSKPISFAYHELASYPKEKQEKISLVKGHFPFGFHSAMTDIPFTYITMLRDPVERVISHYNYELIQGRPYHALASEMNLSEYILSSGVNEVDNGQVRFLSGNLDVPFLQCNKTMLDQAKDNLLKYFSVIGISECFDESVFMLKDTLKWEKHIFYINRNINSKKRPIGIKEVDLIKELNQFDIELYSFAKSILINTIDTNRILKNALSKYRTKNRFFQFIYPFLKTPHAVYNDFKNRNKKKLV